MADLENTLYLDVANSKGEPKGRVTIALRPDLAPNHVARIKELAREGAYSEIMSMEFGEEVTGSRYKAILEIQTT